MKRLAILALASAIACAAMVSAAPGRTSSLYPVVLEMKGDGATISVYSPTNAYIRTTVYVAGHSTRSIAMENAPVYEFWMKECGKTLTARWTRAGAGVRVAVNCSGFSFTQR